MSPSRTASTPQSKLVFFFNGRPIEAEAGDTIGAALYRSGVRVFSRSFKYHRRRGLLCMAGKCPNCLMNVDGAPNVRTCVTPVQASMRVRHQNAYPSLQFDWAAVAQKFDWLMPVGWYYKTFTSRGAWRAVEPYLRRVAGLGVPPPRVEGSGPPAYEHEYWHSQVAVVGGGPAGMSAAVEAAGSGAMVTLIDDQAELGGHLRYSPDGQAKLRELVGQIQAASRLQVLSGSSCFGLYEGNLLGVIQPRPHASVAERLIHLRAQRIVVATGAAEAPLLFENNDLPGVMLSSAAARLIHLYGIPPGKRAVIVGTAGRAEPVAASLQAAGVEVAARVGPSEVLRAEGRSRVTGLRTRDRRIGCDLIVVCGHAIPEAGLLHQAGARLEWSEQIGAFVPAVLPPVISAAGWVTGEGLAPAAPMSPAEVSQSKRCFVCFCEDVTCRDVRDAIAEGFDHIETLKRYTTATMGPCQGKMCQLAAIGICARETGRTLQETGVTTSRPPNPSVSLGALAGARHHPVKRTPLHYEHEALGAVWMDMGEWKRPRYYRRDSNLTEAECVDQEYRSVREAAGLIDVGTLGKLDVKGRDAGKLLDKVYTHRFSDLRPGRVRYAVICDETGVMLDDGTISRLAEAHYFITTTTGNLEFVHQWLKWWLAGAGWDAHVTEVTGGLSSVNLAGPRARDVLSKLTSLDLTAQGFPYMGCRQGEVAGVPAILLRIGFVGETGWEIHVPAEHGERVWKALLEAGAPLGMRPFGVEAQRLLRLEKKHVIVGADTDALSNPYQAGMAWVVKLDKHDFVGSAALRRMESEPVHDRLVGFVMQEDALPEDGAAVVVDGRPAGRVTSARFSPVLGRGIGLAWVPAELAGNGNEILVRAGGRLARARVEPDAFYDPDGSRLRM